jgi:type IV secretory pathway VirD2 relaxase
MITGSPAASSRGLLDELNNRRYVILDGVDGRAHYVDIGQAGEPEPMSVGSTVAIMYGANAVQPRTPPQAVLT